MNSAHDSNKDILKELEKQINVQGKILNYYKIAGASLPPMPPISIPPITPPYLTPTAIDPIPPAIPDPIPTPADPIPPITPDPTPSPYDPIPPTTPDPTPVESTQRITLGLNQRVI